MGLFPYRDESKDSFINRCQLTTSQLGEWKLHNASKLFYMFYTWKKERVLFNIWRQNQMHNRNSLAIFVSYRLARLLCKTHALPIIHHIYTFSILVFATLCSTPVDFLYTQIIRAVSINVFLFFLYTTGQAYNTAWRFPLKHQTK